MSPRREIPQRTPDERDIFAGLICYVSQQPEGRVRIDTDAMRSRKLYAGCKFEPREDGGVDLVTFTQSLPLGKPE